MNDHIQTLYFCPMAIYFKLRCFSQQTAAYVITVSNIIIACLGVFHWGYCGLMGKFVDLYSDPTLIATKDQIQALYNSPIAFYAIAGIQQILTSVGVILLVHSYLGESKYYIWLRVMLGLLIFNFAFNFTIAVSASMNVTFYNQFFKQYLDNIDQYLNGSMGSFLKDYASVLKDFVNYSIAEAVITWIVTLPLIILTVIALLDHSLKDSEEIKPAQAKASTMVNIKQGQKIRN